MTKWVRELASKQLAREVSGAGSVFLVDFRGLSSGLAVELRQALRGQKARLRVVKNAVAKHALTEVGVGSLVEKIDGMNALLWGDDPVGAVKTIREFSEKHKGLAVRAGSLAGKILSQDDIKRLAAMPGRKELLGQFVGVLSTLGAGRFAGTMNALRGQFVHVLAAVERKKKSEA